MYIHTALTMYKKFQKKTKTSFIHKKKAKTNRVFLYQERILQATALSSLLSYRTTPCWIREEEIGKEGVGEVERSYWPAIGCLVIVRYREGGLVRWEVEERK